MYKVEDYRAISYDLYLTIACLDKVSLHWWLIVIDVVWIIYNVTR